MAGKVSATALILAALLLSLAGTADAAAAFVARGNEPGWRLEITGTAVMFTTMNGEAVTIAPVPDVETGDGSRTYKATAKGKPFAATVSDRLCRDTMSGMPHPNTVSVNWGPESFFGCGGEPADLLHGKWRIEAIDGSPVVAGSRPGIVFDTDNRINGNGSCNRFNGAYSLTGESLGFSGLVSTRMACELPLMTQEHALMQALERISRFDIDSEGRLVLLDGDTSRIRARKE